MLGGVRLLLRRSSGGVEKRPDWAWEGTGEGAPRSWRLGGAEPPPLVTAAPPGNLLINDLQQRRGRGVRIPRIYRFMMYIVQCRGQDGIQRGWENVLPLFIYRHNN